jgi:hypothetical protein
MGDRNMVQGDALLKLQKMAVSMIAGKGGLYHANP